jgi:hypothetical protein
MTDQDLDDLLSGFRDDVPAMSEAAFLLGKVQLQAKIEEQTAPAVTALPELIPLPVRRRSRRSPPFWAAAAAVAVVAVGAAVVGNSTASGPHQEVVTLATSSTSPSAYPPAPPRPPAASEADQNGTPLPPATVVYNAAGQLTATDLPQAPGQYLYMHRQEFGQPYATERPGGIVVNTINASNVGYWDEWVPANQSGTWQLSRDVRQGTADVPLPGDPALPHKVSGLSKWEGVFQAPGADYFPVHGTWLEPSEAFLASLPRDPTVLYDLIARNSEDSVDPAAMALEMVANVLDRPVPADLRRALFQALSYHPWITVKDNAKTQDNRPAVSIGIDDLFVKGSTKEILIDPATGYLIGNRVSHGDWEPGTVTHWSVVNQIGATS